MTSYLVNKQTLYFSLPIRFYLLGALGGAIGTLAMITFGIAASAKSSPDGIRTIKSFLLAVVAFGLYFSVGHCVNLLCPSWLAA